MHTRRTAYIVYNNLLILTPIIYRTDTDTSGTFVIDLRNNYDYSTNLIDLQRSKYVSGQMIHTIRNEF